MINKLIASSVSVFPKWFIELFSKSYVAGYSSNEVLSIVEKLNGQGFSATIDILGEHVKDLDISKNITQQYCELFENINLKSIKKVAATGVDRVSIGCITHSVPAVDLKLEI